MEIGKTEQAFIEVRGTVTAAGDGLPLHGSGGFDDLGFGTLLYSLGD